MYEVIRSMERESLSRRSISKEATFYHEGPIFNLDKSLNPISNRKRPINKSLHLKSTHELQKATTHSDKSFGKSHAKSRLKDACSIDDWSERLN